MSQRKLPAVFMRGGTSKAVVLHARDLPANRDEWAPIFLSFMGSPDPSMRQLDGMGGGVSSLSKVCVIGPPSRPDADIDYTFAQVRIERAHVDYGGNCGNMSSAMGPFAVDEGLLVPRPKGSQAVVRIHNTNTKKIIVSPLRPWTAGGRRVGRHGHRRRCRHGLANPARVSVEPGGAAYRQAPPYGAGHR